MFGDLDKPDGPAGLRLLSYYGRTGMFAAMRLLLPSDHILFADGSRVPSGETFRFSRESLRGEFVSGIVPDIETGGHAVISAVPVIHDGRVTALLFGVVRLEDLPRYWQPGSVLRSMTTVLVDAETADVLLDTTFGLVGRRAPL
ncbi:MAG: cache domain-containing protein [Sutterella sp.]|nr:cache domain-containing protein [Sutterella sp.]